MKNSSAIKEKHIVTPDLILRPYKEAKKMNVSEKEKALENLKQLVKYIGKEVTL